MLMPVRVAIGALGSHGRMIRDAGPRCPLGYEGG
jgi:hypothetical protein